MPDNTNGSPDQVTAQPWVFLQYDGANWWWWSSSQWIAFTATGNQNELDNTFNSMTTPPVVNVVILNTSTASQSVTVTATDGAISPTSPMTIAANTGQVVAFTANGNTSNSASLSLSVAGGLDPTFKVKWNGGF